MRILIFVIFIHLTQILCWELIQPSTPRNNISYPCSIQYKENSQSYILSHGGQFGSNLTGLSDLWRFSVSTSSWEKLMSNDSPNLTNHRCTYKPPTNSVLYCGGNNDAVENGFIYEYFISNNTWVQWKVPSSLAHSLQACHYLEELDSVLVRRRSPPVLSQFQLGKTIYTELSHQSDIPYSVTDAKSLYVPELDAFFTSGGLIVDFSLPNPIYSSSQFSQFNVTEKTWSYQNLTVGLSDHVMVATWPYIYLWGGCLEAKLDENVVCSRVSSTLYQYNLETQTWAQYETDLKLYWTSTVLVEDALYIYGGLIEGGDRQFNMYKIDLPTENMPTSASTLTKGQTRFPVIVGMLLLVMGLFSVSLAVLYLVLKKMTSKKDVLTIPLVSINNEN